MMAFSPFNPDHRTYVSVDPTRWADEQVKKYIERLEAEVTRLYQENRALSWKLAAVYEEQKAVPVLERISELIDGMYEERPA